MLNWFNSSNKKLVIKWQKEHIKIIEAAHKVVNSYVKNNEKKTKKELINLSNLIADHIESEDTSFYKLKKDKDTAKDIKESIEHFDNTFAGIKPTLMKFLTKYSKEDEKLDDVFFDTFSEITEVLKERIDFEENSLYLRLEIL